MTSTAARVWDRLRPLDPVRSVRMKFVVVVGVSAVLCTWFTWLALVVLEWRVRYALIVAVLLSLAVSQLIAHGMTLPLRQLTAATREVARGRPAPPVRTRSRDEVGELVQAFGAMSQEIAAVEEQRRQLLGNVGHELRTPVAALRAQVENLADGVRAPDAVALAEVLAQVERLGDLLEDLLDLARAEGGAVPLDRHPFRVGPWLQDVAAEVFTARPDRSVQVSVTPQTLMVDADPHRLGQVVTNLLDNAARHAAARVRVDAWSDGDTVVLEVLDDGPGIPQEKWDTVFERFRGGTGPIPIAGHADPGGGTGLGLAIARWAVMLHDGRIAVVPSDVGCRVRVDLPQATRA